jgi:hypothetical protein
MLWLSIAFQESKNWPRISIKFSFNLPQYFNCKSYILTFFLVYVGFVVRGLTTYFDRSDELDNAKTEISRIRDLNNEYQVQLTQIRTQLQSIINPPNPTSSQGTNNTQALSTLSNIETPTEPSNNNDIDVLSESLSTNVQFIKNFVQAFKDDTVLKLGKIGEIETREIQDFRGSNEQPLISGTINTSQKLIDFLEKIDTLEEISNLQVSANNNLIKIDSTNIKPLSQFIEAIKTQLETNNLFYDEYTIILEEQYNTSRRIKQLDQRISQFSQKVLDQQTAISSTSSSSNSPISPSQPSQGGKSSNTNLQSTEINTDSEWRNLLVQLNLPLILLVIVFGASGSVVSVITRAPEVIKETQEKDLDPFLAGFLKPLMGMFFALFVFTLLEAGFLPFSINQENKKVYFYISVAFIAGFSEKKVMELITNTANKIGEEKSSESK